LYQNQMRKICIFGANHEFQEHSPTDYSFYKRLRRLIQDHKIDTMFEEATGLPPKSSVELLADELGLAWLNVDLTKDERRNLPDSALTSRHDTLQDLDMHRKRENAWVKAIGESGSHSGLLVCGLCHVFSVGEKLCTRGFVVETHIYSPDSIYHWDWSSRPTVVPDDSFADPL
jgi:hypothetical protein